MKLTIDLGIEPPLTVIGEYADHTAIQRVEIAGTRREAWLIVCRWEIQHFDGIISVWQRGESGACFRVSGHDLAKEFD